MSNNWPFPYYATKADADSAVASESTARTVEFVDKSTDNLAGSIAFTVPVGTLRIELPVLIDQGTASITVATNPRTLVRGTTPASGQVAIQGNWMTFHSSDAGLAAAITNWKPYGTVFSSGMMHYIFAWLRKLVGASQSVRVTSFFEGFQAAAASADEAFAITNPTSKTSGTWRVVAVTAYARVAETGDTTIRVAAAWTGSPSTNYWQVVIPSGQKSAKATAATNGTVDVAHDGTLSKWIGVAGGHGNIHVSVELAKQ